MKTIFHPATSRGHVNFGWLDSYHSFSFGRYYDPERVQFGALRVLNDDTVSPGMGFGTHPHENMEIVSIPLSGDLEHKDSMGNTGVIREGDVQVMSAGTGIKHSEYNKNKDQEVKFLQIWIIPERTNVTPRYDQLRLEPARQKNQWQQIISPDPETEGTWIHQQSWFQMANLENGTALEYVLHQKNNGAYLFLLEGALEVAGKNMDKRDGLGVWDTDKISMKAKGQAKILLIEVPMSIN